MIRRIYFLGKRFPGQHLALDVRVLMDHTPLSINMEFIVRSFTITRGLIKTSATISMLFQQPSDSLVQAV